jgi:LmbE family N-acetylglucosaminyl deacetylase
MKAALVVSPHLDDAVLSVGQFLAGRPGTTVATIFAGYPKVLETQTDYDKLSGFNSAGEAITNRRIEDRLALAHLEAAPVHLDHLDHQYGEEPDFAAIVEELKALITRVDPEFIAGPLGLLHPDHSQPARPS